MAEKLSVQIELQGGEEIARQLKDIGEAGQKAFADIAKSAEQVGGFKNIKPEDVTAKLKEMGVTGVDAIKKIQDAVASASKLETLVQGITSVENGFAALARAAPLIGTAIVVAFTAAIKVANQFADSVNKASAEAAKLGVNIGQFDKLKRGLEGAGISPEAIKGLEQFQKNLDKLDLEKARQEFNKLNRDVAVSDMGAKQFEAAQDKARGFSIEAAGARTRLDELAKPIPFEIINQLARLQQSAGNVSTKLPALVEILRQLPDSAGRSALAIKLLGDDLGIELIQALQTGSLAVDAFVQKLGGMTEAQVRAAATQRQTLNQLSADWQTFKVEVGAPLLSAGIVVLTESIKVASAFASTFSTLGSVINTVATAGATALGGMVNAVTGLGTGIANLVAAIGGITWSVLDAGVAAWNAIVTAIQGAGTAITTFVSSLTGITWDAIANAGVAAWDAVTAAVQRFIDKVLVAIGLKPSGGAPAAANGGGSGMARGGLLGGRGSGTSDSNVAWVSRGEHIMPARAVAQPGVLAFLEALRRSGGNLRGVLDGMGRFALGGMVPRPAMAFASGGMVGGNLGTLTLGLPSGESVTVRASAGVADQLRREAALAQVRSGGRKPSRYT